MTEWTTEYKERDPFCCGRRRKKREWNTKYPTEPGFYWQYVACPDDPEFTCVQALREAWESKEHPLRIRQQGLEYDYQQPDYVSMGCKTYWLRIDNVPEPPAE